MDRPIQIHHIPCSIRIYESHLKEGIPVIDLLNDRLQMLDIRYLHLSNSQSHTIQNLDGMQSQLPAAAVRTIIPDGPCHIRHTDSAVAVDPGSFLSCCIFRNRIMQPVAMSERHSRHFFSPLASRQINRSEEIVGILKNQGSFRTINFQPCRLFPVAVADSGKCAVAAIIEVQSPCHGSGKLHVKRLVVAGVSGITLHLLGMEGFGQARYRFYRPQQMNQRMQVIAAHIVGNASACGENKRQVRMVFILGQIVASGNHSLGIYRFSDKTLVNQVSGCLQRAAQERIGSLADTQPLALCQFIKLQCGFKIRGHHFLGKYVLS